MSYLILLEYPKKFSSKLDFAAACDVDEKTIRRILKGEQNVSIGILLRICFALNIKPSELFEMIDL